MKAVRQSAAARRDLVQIVAYLAEQSDQAARRFRARAEATFNRIAERPGMGTPYDPDDPAYEGLRYFPISGFRRHIVFYREMPDGIEIIRVLHGARDITAILEEEFGMGDDQDS